jgi:hypothetical protein
MVNNVLKRLRESTVSSVNQTPYSSLIGVLINDAKEEVENAWDWSALRTTITATTQDGVFSYVLTDTDNSFKILDVLNDSDDFVMQYADASWMNRMFLLGTTQMGSPTHYSYNGTNSTNENIVDVFPIPDAAYTLRFNGVMRQPNLENYDDVLQIPAHPVLMLAYAKAVEERGEDGGTSAAVAYQTAGRSINDAISLDAARHPEELIWQVV